jgi:chromosome segregation ATPase
LLKSLPRLQSQEDVLTMNISKLAGEISAYKARLAGVDAAKELSARHAEFEEAQRNTQPLKQQRIEVGSRLGEIAPLLKAATEQRSVAHLKWEQAKAAIADAEAQLRIRKASRRRAPRNTKPCAACAIPGIPCRQTGSVPRTGVNWWRNMKMSIRSNCASAV